MGIHHQPVTQLKRIMTSQRVEYWDAKWKANQSSWHIDGTNHFLVKYFNHITKIKNPARILVPLCGKAVDVKWMYDLGHSVVGIEGVEEPIIQFFTEQHLEYLKKWSEIAHAIQQKMEGY